MPRAFRTLGAVLVVVVMPRPAPAQGPFILSRLENIRLDGRLGEPAWLGATRLPFLQFLPSAGALPADSTMVLIGHDASYLYVGGRFRASPGTIQATSLTRDRLGADDVFRLTLDTFDDNVNAVQFATTPAGVQADFAISQDGQTITDSWNTFWDVATSRDEDGWIVEMRIPLSSLRFQSVAGVVQMGVIASRYTARRNELSTFPRLDPRVGNAPQRPSFAATITLQDIHQRTPVYLTPYALGGRRWEFRPTPDGFALATDNVGEAGLDLKAAIASNLSLDLTLNTDFAQVEADVEQVNLTRFSLFFPEKRQFFQERAGIFQVGTGGLLDNGLLFHSRRVGLDEQGRPLRIYGGARLVGRSGGWDVGFMDMQTDVADGGGSENLGVLSLRRRVLNAESTAGLLVTSRLGARGSRNMTWGVDARLRVLADDYLVAQMAGTEASDAPGGTDAAMARIAIERPSTLSSQGFAYTAGLKWSGPGFDPGLGFQPRRDFAHAFTNVRFGFFPGATSPIRVIQPSLAVSAFWRNRDDVLDTFFGAFFLNYELKSGVNGWAGGSRHTEDLVVPLPLGDDVEIPAGRYTWHEAQVGVFPSTGSTLQVGFLLSGGGFYDGIRRAVSGSVRWSPSAHLTLETAYQRQHQRFDSRGQTLDADLGQLRILYAMDTRLSVSSLLQYNRLLDQAAGNVRVRYRFAEGRDLYLVWNERLNIDLDRNGPAGPVLPRSQGRTLQVKYSHTLIR